MHHRKDGTPGVVCAQQVPEIVTVLAKFRLQLEYKMYVAKVQVTSPKDCYCTCKIQMTEYKPFVYLQSSGHR